MKIFHLSDLHIGLKLMNHDLHEDQKHILEEVVKLAAERRPQAVVIAGDIYDKAVPSADAVSLFDHFVTELASKVPTAVIMMISGNHDNNERINVFRNVLEKQNIYMIGLPPRHKDEKIARVTLRDAYGPVNFYLLPFVKPSMVKEITGVDKDGNNFSYDEAVHQLILREKLNEQERNVLVSHQFYLSTGKDDTIERSQSEIVTVGNIDSVQGDILNLFDYAALGHIHKAQRLNGKDCYRYSGTPIACSFSEEGQQKGLLEVELEEKGKVSTEFLPLEPLRQVRTLKDTLSNVLAQPSADYVSITLTDADDYVASDVREWLDTCFPNLLHIGRESKDAVNYQLEQEKAVKLSPFELCRDFLQDLEAEDEAVLASIINEVQEAEK